MVILELIYNNPRSKLLHGKGSNVDNDQTTSNLDNDVNGLKKPTRDINTKDMFVSHIDNSSIERMLNESWSNIWQ